MKERLFIMSIYEAFGCESIIDTRKRKVLIVRQAMYIYLYYHAELPYEKVAKMLNVTHATVLNAEKRYNEYIRTDKNYRKKTDEIIDFCDKRYNEIFNNKEYRINNICKDLEQRIYGMRIAGVNSDIFNNRLLKLRNNG